MKKLESGFITNVEAKLILQATDRRNKDVDEKVELGHEQKVTLDYLRNVAKANKSDIEGAKKKLAELGVLKDHQIMILLNLLPKDKDEIDVIFQKERTTLTKEQIEKILEIVKKV
ncbi:MAG: DNA-directed RNA polymerase subunit F [Nanoarchaeota archaeon]|nr:DNA-directed RNA polymerase subunit F [Nanoarchaeota archaeon]MBU4451729.1 DNA-directed RNA polymerase subunit F [Nanoarchaeota archaeon]MCG2723698.1 DNA-directed RNA polymerase subunit F [archaeon]